jgi:SAM-dependent methyltransferase
VQAGDRDPLLRRAATSARLRLADAVDVALRRHDALTPPRRLRGLAGDSDFVLTGEELLGHVREFAGLRARDRVLDIGCGAGRLARLLARELRPPGSYDGIDVARVAITWCQAHYDGLPAPFRFDYVDVNNAMYNPSGAVDPRRYRFPFDDGSFDLIVAMSLFTHLTSEAADRYLSEVARVLAPEGRFLSTWFLLDSVSAPPTTMFAFVPVSETMAAVDPALPELAVAYDIEWMQERVREHGLALTRAPMRGRWTGQPGPTTHDLVIAGKPLGSAAAVRPPP